jgi:hypothetical protein
MANPSVMVRQEHLRNLPALAARLVSWRADSMKDEAAVVAALKQGVEAECELCGMRVGGEDLAGLAKAATGSESPKVARLRLGYCARQGCHSYYYKIRFHPMALVDWSKVLGDVGDEVLAPPSGVEAERPSDRLKSAALGSIRRLAPRIVLGVLVIGTLLLVRHWRRGGTVPWIREPEKFQVDVPRAPR